MDIFSKIINLLKLPIKFIFLLAIIMGGLLFLPEKIILKLKLTDFIIEYGKYIGIIFIFSVGYIIILLFPYINKKIINKISTKKNKLITIKNLNNLTYPEKCFLREFFIQNKDVIEAPLECTELTSLYNKNIIHFASKNVRSYIYGNFTSITINPLIKGKINLNHVELPNGEPNQDELERVKRERPDFLINLEKINNMMNGRRWY